MIIFGGGESGLAGKQRASSLDWPTHGPRAERVAAEIVRFSSLQGFEPDGEQEGGDRVRRSILTHLQALRNYTYPPVTLSSSQGGGTEGKSRKANGCNATNQL